jgi:hypothetical protein
LSDKRFSSISFHSSIEEPGGALCPRVTIDGNSERGPGQRGARAPGSRSSTGGGGMESRNIMEMGPVGVYAELVFAMDCLVDAGQGRIQEWNTGREKSRQAGVNILADFKRCNSPPQRLQTSTHLKVLPAPPIHTIHCK